MQPAVIHELAAMGDGGLMGDANAITGGGSDQAQGYISRPRVPVILYKDRREHDIRELGHQLQLNSRVHRRIPVVVLNMQSMRAEPALKGDEPGVPRTRK